MASRLITSLLKRKSFYGSTVRIFSPAKINLYLNCVGTYTSRAGRNFAGFHRIESIFERISFGDTIRIEITRAPCVEIISNIACLQAPTNLIVRALEVVKKTCNIPFGFRVHLKKNIPLGSGLGGGSSNAASALLAVDALCNLKLATKKMYQIGCQLGSDVNFFLSQARFAWVEGKGELVTPLDVPVTLRHTIIWPGISLSTKKVYQHTRVKLTKFFSSVNILRHALQQADIRLIEKSIFNVLESKACMVCPRLDRIKDRLRSSGVNVTMTGSGSAFYTVDSCIKDRRSSVRVQQEKPEKISHTPLLRTLRKDAPGNWLVARARTF